MRRAIVAVLALAILAFAMHVPAGLYELTVRDVDDSQGGAYLLPSQHTVTVTATGFQTSIDLAFGGVVSVDVRDRHGTRLGERSYSPTSPART